ncbi:MAG: type III-A CRISPR-associated RAMP protein Csm4 [Actinobacteria bacterium]|nr:type III-A CRISPR-associated RAMP protein Csm4 [Actinomycetota bacterium]
MAVRVFHLKPLSPFHLGEATGAMDRVGEIAHSDTLFSGLCHAWQRLFGTEALESFLASFSAGLPPLRISSAFPYREGGGGEGFTYYLPWPRGSRSFLRLEDRKLPKRTPFLPLGLFRKFFLEGSGYGMDSQGQVEVSPRDEELLRDEAKRLREGIRVDTRISSALCRLTMGAVPYHLSALAFARGWGLYFLAEGEEETLETARGALRLLGDMGLGGDRSTGYGGYLLEEGDPSTFGELLRRDTGRFMALSLVFPGTEEREKLRGSRVGLLERKGWIDSPQLRASMRKKRTLMIEEGSVLASPLAGALVDVTPGGWPGHKIYRYGIGFYLPLPS